LNDIDPHAPIFVAGGTGMVGSAIIRKLLSSGYTNLVANYHSRKPAGTPEGNVRFVHVDLRRQSDTEAFFEGEKPEYVFLAAARVGGILANDTYKAEFIYDNITIAANVLHCAYQSAVKKLLNLGSSCIYPRLALQPLKEEYLLTGPLEPTNEPYAIAKIAAIKLCRYFNEQYGTDFLSVMPTNLYGPYDNFNLETAHVLPALIRKFHLAKLLRARDFQALRTDIERSALGFGLDEKISLTNDVSCVSMLESVGITSDYVQLWGSGEPYREFLHVDDLSEAALLVMERFNSADIGEFVNVGAGEDMKIRDIAHLVKEIAGFQGNIAHDLSKQDGMPRKVLDISSITRLGWRPTISLEDGIRKTYEWYAGDR
jgi:GDP-L-fucose synthase